MVGKRSPSQICGGFGDCDCSLIQIPSEHGLEIDQKPCPCPPSNVNFIIGVVTWPQPAGEGEIARTMLMFNLKSLTTIKNLVPDICSNYVSIMAN
jgi:hypothetical protein